MSLDLVQPGPSETRAEPPPVRRWPSYARIGAGVVGSVLLPLALFWLHAARFGEWIVDDAGISFAYARSIADGNGVVQQPGAPLVEGYSNPLWTALLALLRLVGVFDHGNVVAGVPDYVLVPKALAVVCVCGVLVLFLRMFQALLGGWAAVVASAFAGLLLAANPSFVGWAVSGLENPLYALLVAALAALLVRAVAAGRLLRPRVVVAASMLALGAAATRPDGLVYAVACPLLVLVLLRRDLLARSLRAVGLALAVFGAPAAVLLLVRHQVFGLWVPNTAVAKAQGLDLNGFGKVVDLVTYLGWPVVLVAAGVTGLACARSRDPERPGLLPAYAGLLAMLTLSLGAFAVQNPGSMGHYRFATPIWVTGSAVFAGAVVHVLRDQPTRTRVLVAAVTLASVAASVVGLDVTSRRFHEAPSIPVCVVAERSRLFDELARRLGVRDGSLLVPDLGGALLTSTLTVYDRAGLTDRTIAEARRDGNDRALGDYVFDRLRPTFVHVHGYWREPLVSDARLRRDYLALGNGEDFVRRSAVRDPDAARDAVAFVVAARRRLSAWTPAHRRSSCGPRLSPGSASAIRR